MSDEAKPTKITQVEEYTRVSSKMKVFSYRPPEEMKRNRAFVPMVRSDVMLAMVQIITKGGEQELHSHGALDGFWFVLKGSARFYGENDVVLATLNMHEGIYIPHDFLYWFEAVGDEPLELLQVEARDKTLKNSYYSPEPKPVSTADILTPEGSLIAAGMRVEQ